MRFGTLLRIGIVCAATVASFVRPTAGQQPGPPVTFQVEVSYVDIDAIVTDEQGNFVRGLTKDDFELFDDGRPQKIDTFSQVDIPLVRRDRFPVANRPVSSDVKTNAEPFAGRLYVLVLDDLNTSPLRTQMVVRAARQFIEQYFGSNDLAAVAYTSGRTDASQEFTSDRRLLLAAVDKFQGRKLRSVTLQKADQYFQQHLKELEANKSDDNSGQPAQSGTIRGPIGYSDITTDVDDFERGHRAQQVLGMLRNMAEFMGSIRGRRKAMLMFSEGIDYPIYDIFGSQAATTVVMATRDAIAAAARSNVSFFAIDPRGLVGMSSEAVELTAAADPHLGFDARGLLAEMRLSQDSLLELADETGGLAFVNANNVAPAFDRIVRANSTYYVLGYYPANPSRDGRFHKIEVRMKRPGLRVTARKGYVSPRGKAPEERVAEKLKQDERDRLPRTSVELREILRQPLQRNGLTLAVQAAPFKGAAREASIALAVEVDGERLQFDAQQNNVFEDEVEVSFFALDERGRSHPGNFFQFKLSLRPDTYERVRRLGFRLNPRLALPPGRYQLRVGVHERGGGALGSVFYDLDVPDYTKELLAMSGLLITAPAARNVFTPEPDPEIPTDLLPGPATSRREFTQNDTLSLFAEVYDNIPSRQPHQIEIGTTLLSEDGRAVFSSRETLSGESMKANRSSRVSHTKQIPLKDIQPGRYLLRVEVQARGDVKGAKPAARETLLTVVRI